MTREEVKAQLAKCPLEWKEDDGRPVYGLHSRVTLIDGEDGDEDAYDREVGVWELRTCQIHRLYHPTRGTQGKSRGTPTIYGLPTARSQGVTLKE